MFNNSRITIWHYLILFLFIYLAFFLGIAAYPLANNNEGLYAEIAREMLVSGNYIIPHLNFIPYLEKPPLLYWLIAGSYHLFGVTAFAARLVPTASATLICFGLFWFGKKIGRLSEAWLTAIMLASSLGFVIVVRVVFFDMLLTACVTLSLLLFYIWYLSNKKIYLRIAYIFLALGVLCKGLLALVLVPVIAITFLYIIKQRSRILHLFDALGLIIFFAIVLPWHIAAVLSYQGFFYDYFINEQFLRFLNERIPRDYYHGPIYYYLPRILIYIFPWSLLLPLLAKRSKVTDKNPDKLNLFLWLWVLIPLFFFSISQAKANYYMIISMPALLFLIANKLQKSINKRETGIFIFSSSVLLLLFATGLFYGNYTNYAFIADFKNLSTTLNYWLIGLLIYSMLLSVLSVWFYSKNSSEIRIPVFQWRAKHASRALLLIFGTSIITIAILILAYTNIGILKDQISEKSLVNYIKTHDKTRPVYLYKNYAKQSTLLFYLQKRVILIDSSDNDLAYGAHSLEASGWFISSQEFAEQAQEQYCYVALLKDNLNDFNSNPASQGFCTVADSGVGVLLSNQPSDCTA